MISLQTDRLRLRPFEPQDQPSLFELDSDPEVMRYIGAYEVTPESTRKLLERLIERQSRWTDYGTWVAEVKSTGEWIGWFTLKPLPQLDENFEVGYRLLKRHWGKGYATEGTRTLVRYGFEKLHLPKIIGLTHLENQASQNVLQKCGLQLVGPISNPFSPTDPDALLFERKA